MSLSVSVYFIKEEYEWLKPVADHGGQSGHGPPTKLAMEFGLPGSRTSNDSIVNLPKSNDFGPPPVSLSAMDLAPLRKTTILKH